MAGTGSSSSASPTGSPIEDARKKNPCIFIDVSIGDDHAGKMVFELSADVVPKTAENLRALCTGDLPYLFSCLLLLKGVGKTTILLLYYRGTRFHSIIKGPMAQILKQKTLSVGATATEQEPAGRGSQPPEPSRDSAKLRACQNADAAPKAPRRVVKARAFPFPFPTTTTPAPHPPFAQRTVGGGGGVHPPTAARSSCAPPRISPSPPPRRPTRPNSLGGRRPAASLLAEATVRLAGRGDEAIVERGARVGQRRRRRQRERGGAADVRPAVGGGAAGGGADAGAGTRRALHPRGASRLRPPPLALRLLPHSPRLRISGDQE